MRKKMRKNKRGKEEQRAWRFIRARAGSKRPKGPKRSASDSPGRPSRPRPQDKARGAPRPGAAPTQNEAGSVGNGERSGLSPKSNDEADDSAGGKKQDSARPKEQNRAAGVKTALIGRIRHARVGADVLHQHPRGNHHRPHLGRRLNPRGRLGVADPSDGARGDEPLRGGGVVLGDQTRRFHQIFAGRHPNRLALREKPLQLFPSDPSGFAVELIAQRNPIRAGARVGAGCGGWGSGSGSGG